MKLRITTVNGQQIDADVDPATFNFITFCDNVQIIGFRNAMVCVPWHAIASILYFDPLQVKPEEVTRPMGGTVQ